MATQANSVIAKKRARWRQNISRIEGRWLKGTEGLLMMAQGTDEASLASSYIPLINICYRVNSFPVRRPPEAGSKSGGN
jgi:hypothetical protein